MHCDIGYDIELWLVQFSFCMHAMAILMAKNRRAFCISQRKLCGIGFATCCHGRCSLAVFSQWMRASYGCLLLRRMRASCIVEELLVLSRWKRVNCVVTVDARLC